MIDVILWQGAFPLLYFLVVPPSQFLLMRDPELLTLLWSSLGSQDEDKRQTGVRYTITGDFTDLTMTSDTMEAGLLRGTCF